MIICVLYFFIKEYPITFLEKRNCDYGNIEQYSTLGYKTNISKRWTKSKHQNIENNDSSVTNTESENKLLLLVLT